MLIVAALSIPTTFFPESSTFVPGSNFTKVLPALSSLKVKFNISPLTVASLLVLSVKETFIFPLAVA